MGTVITRKLFFYLLFIFCSHTLFAQGGLPVFVINNGTVSATNSWVVDPSSLQGNYTVGNTTMVFNGPAGTQFGVFLDSFRLKSDNDAIYIYDGNSVSSPLLASYTRSISSWSVKSTTNSITILFHAVNEAPQAGAGFRIGLRTISSLTTDSPTFLPIAQAFTGWGMTDMADYDNDGDKDLLADGIVFENTSFNDSAYLFNRVKQPIGAWNAAKMVSADFNGDGSKDVFVTGVSNLSGTFKPTTALFKNNGDNTFTQINIPAFTNLGNGACAVRDFNNDGKPDIAFTGSVDLSASGCIFKIFINNGNFGFAELSTTIPGLIASSMDWYDYDNDGDQDLALNGYKSSGNLSSIFKNNSNTSFTEINLQTFQTSSGNIKWADMNGDGKYDVVLTGVTTPGNVNAITPEILLNNGSDNFARQSTNLPALCLGSFDCYDYDNDGDADLVYGGLVANSPNTEYGVYKNNGNGNFTRIHSRAGAQSLTTVKWIDLNADNRKDIFIGGRDNYSPSFVLKNMGADSFKIASYPFTGYAPGSNSNVLVDDLNGDGVVDFLFAGNIDDQDCVEGNTSSLTVSGGWKNKPTINLQPKTNLRNVGSVTVTGGSFWRWGDVDNDGKSDVILTYGQEPLRIFKNNGNGNFSLMYSGKINNDKVYEQSGVVDIDNDGVNELYVLPNKLYKWNGSAFQTLYEDNLGCEANAAMGCEGYFDFADYNKDGFMDVAFVQGGFLYILRNNKSGRLVNDYAGSFHSMGPDQRVREIRWADYDADGDPDLITRDGIFENTSWGGFRFRGVSINDFGNIGFSDFNKDGKLDILTLNRTPPELKPAHIFYNQQGSSFFQENTPPDFFKSYGGSYRNGIYVNDLDNDGDDDIVYTSFGDCTYTGIYVNQFNDTHKHIQLQSPNGGESFPVGSPIIIQWSGYQLGNSVKIEVSADGGNNYSLIMAAAPGGAAGGQFSFPTTGVPVGDKYRIRITDNSTNALIDSSDRNFRIFISNIPAITSFTPTTAATGTTVTISGTNFTGATAVSFGGVAATSFTVVNATTITAIVANGSSGSVSVTTPGGMATRAGFVFIPAPTITSFTPTTGSTGNTITITGTNFTNASAVNFGGVAASSFTIVNATTITAVVANGASGSVTVVTPGGTATMAGFTFTDIRAAEITIVPNPSNDIVVATHPLSVTASYLKIIDINGRIVKQVNIAQGSSSTSFSVKGLPAGIYKLFWTNGIDIITKTLMVSL